MYKYIGEYKMKNTMKFNSIDVIVCDTYEELSETAAQIVADEMKKKDGFVLGLATGSSPVGLYSKLAEKNKAGEIDFSNVKTFNLDEYYPISPDNDQSYRYFMNKNLFNNVNIKMENTRVPDGTAGNTDEFCDQYEADIKAAGGVDLQVLGIGNNGHIGFNEPADKFCNITHVVELTENTIEANSRFFESADLVPKKAITMGVGTIMNAKKIVLVANGKNKAQALYEALCCDVKPANQASVLQYHKDVTFVVDKDAASLLK